jgi:HAD superfamily hydrolase (TIGR01490 family)
MKKFAVFDIDGTLFRWQLFSEVVFELMQDGYIPREVRAEVEAKMSQWRNRKTAHSFHDYEMTIVKAFIPYITKVPVAAIEAAADKILARVGNQVYVYTRNLIAELKTRGYVLIAISGSQDEIVQRFAKLWQFDIALGQKNDQKDGQYTGTIPGGTLLVLRKGEALKEIVAAHGLSWKESIAVGDTFSDAGMLELVEKPIAFNPNEQLFVIAKEHGWPVVIERKNMIYELEASDGTYLLAKAAIR